jgi:hypothetical protein
MATKELRVRVKHAYLSAAEWVSKNPILQAGELGIESDTQKYKIGDGVTKWSNLSYVSGITVDESISSTSTNPVQNKVIYNALSGKVGTDIFSGFALINPTSTISWRQDSQFFGTINASNYSGTAGAAIRDSEGNKIIETYVKKANFDKIIDELGVAFQEKVDRSDLSDVATSGQYSDLRGKPDYIVQSVNNVRPDENGNVTINILTVTIEEMKAMFTVK